MENNKLTMTVEEMAGRVGVSRATAYILINTVGFPVLRVGRRVLIPVDGLKRWIDAQAGKQIEVR